MHLRLQTDCSQNKQYKQNKRKTINFSVFDIKKLNGGRYMKDKDTSIISLCLSILAVIVAVCVAISSLVSINDLANIDASRENLPGASALVVFGEH